MEYIVWDETYVIGHPKIDVQHCLLVNLINYLGGEIERGDLDAVSIVLWELEDYIQTHFAAEERLMEGCGFPGLSRHRDLHHGFREQVSRLAEQTRRENKGQELLTFLTTWLTKHILKVDRELVRFVNSST